MSSSNVIIKYSGGTKRKEAGKRVGEKFLILYKIIGLFNRTEIKINMTDHEQYMLKALEEAKVAASEGEIPVGAIVVCQGKIIARAHNETEKLNDVTAHAEMIATTMAAAYLGGKYLKECTLYVTLEPCTMCAGALAWAQLGTLVTGAPDPHRGYSRLNPPVLHPRTQVITGILAEECSNIVVQFFKEKR